MKLAQVTVIHVLLVLLVLLVMLDFTLMEPVDVMPVLLTVMHVLFPVNVQLANVKLVT